VIELRVQWEGYEE